MISEPLNLAFRVQGLGFQASINRKPENAKETLKTVAGHRPRLLIRLSATL